jgi:hypothetical protein
MTDALSSNGVANEATVIRCHCLAHERHKFSDLEETFPHVKALQPSDTTP